MARLGWRSMQEPQEDNLSRFKRTHYPSPPASRRGRRRSLTRPIGPVAAPAPPPLRLAKPAIRPEL